MDRTRAPTPDHLSRLPRPASHAGRALAGNQQPGGFHDPQQNVRYAARPEFDLNKDRNVKQLMRMWNFVEYIGVVVPIAERKAKANSAYTGDGGAFEGQLVIYRPGEEQPICHTPFSATGSGIASYKMRVGENNTDHQNKAQHALKRALCEAISKELETQIGRISSVLSPSRISCSSA